MQGLSLGKKKAPGTPAFPGARKGGDEEKKIFSTTHIYIIGKYAKNFNIKKGGMACISKRRLKIFLQSA
jgi:hypothetical protein